MPSIANILRRLFQRLLKSDWEPPKAPITQPSKLAAYADEHLFYEINILLGVATWVSPKHPSVSQAEQTFVESLRAEGIALHLRNLIEFLYPDEFRPKPNSVCAHHFLDSGQPYEDWLNARPGLPKELRRVKQRANREIAHLTSDRIPGAPAAKRWEVEALLTELHPLLALFAQMAAPDRLGTQTPVVVAALGELLKHVKGMRP